MENDGKQYECSYCGDIVEWSDRKMAYVHTTNGERVKAGGPGDLISDRHNRRGTTVLAVDVIEREHRHTWVSGMMYVHDEDVDAIARERRASGESLPECEKCEQVYVIED